MVRSAAAAADVVEIDINAYQEKVLALPEQINLFLGGGRGAGKNKASALEVARHCASAGNKARVLWVRRTLGALTDAIDMVRETLQEIFGPHRYNANEHIIRLPNGAQIEFGYLDSPADYDRYQGRSFSRIVCDEAGQYDDLTLLDLTRSNLRAPKGIPTRMILAANPGGVGHALLNDRYATKPRWQPFQDAKTGQWWINSHGTYRDNKFIDQDAYLLELRAACQNDEELLRAWVEGDWGVVRGAFFASVLSFDRVAVDPFPEDFFSVIATTRRKLRKNCPNAPAELLDNYVGGRWATFLSHDHGVAAPSVCYLVAQSPGAFGPCGRYYTKGSLVLVDELATTTPGSNTRGTGATVPDVAESIKGMCRRWGVSPSGVADDAIWGRTGHAVGSIADEFGRCGVSFQRAQKGLRVGGWERMRRMLADAGSPDKPGLYVSTSCRYWWATVPYLARDPRNPDDVDSNGPDHGADATRYALTRASFSVYPR